MTCDDMRDMPVDLRRQACKRADTIMRSGISTRLLYLGANFEVEPFFKVKHLPECWLLIWKQWLEGNNPNLIFYYESKDINFLTMKGFKVESFIVSQNVKMSACHQESFF